MANHQTNIFRQAEKLGFGELHFKIDPTIGLFAIIAIHNTEHGPALGGCRWVSYPSTRDAIYDALRLARSMTLKSAISGLRHGGGKAVLIRPDKPVDREKYFKAYAEFLNELGGIYITAADSGTSPGEMDIISRHTAYVTSTTAIGNPAPYTAQGVLRGMKAAVNVKLGKENLKGLHIALQGVGQVGYLIAKACHAAGASLTVSDINQSLSKQCAEDFGAAVVAPEKIHAIPCDIFSPCALGGILNGHTIPEIQCAIIAGSANNQLENSKSGQLLHRLGILYAPDYVINAGGLIHASGNYYGASDAAIKIRIDNIYDTFMTIFSRAQQSHRATSDIADDFALEKLKQEPAPW